MTSEGGLLAAEVKNEEDFYFQMRRSVAILKVTLKNGTLLYSGGVFVDGDQNVITCNQNIPEDYKEILIRSVEGCFQVAELVKRYIGSDLAIIKYANELDEEEKAKIKAVEFADVIVVGMEVYAISHAGKLAYNFTVGQVAYPVGPVDDDDDDYRCRLAGEYSELEEIGVDKYTDLIQLNNTHMDNSQCSIGCPVFNASGQLIGLKCLKVSTFDICYHAKDVKEIVEKHHT